VTRIEWRCSQCGASGAIDYTGDPLMRRVMLDVENAHAASSPECPLDRDRLELSTFVECS
jgi:hypothetical protein